MNNKFGRDGRYRNERYRDNRDDRVSEDRFGDQRWLRSPDQEFETSGPYRQPQGETYGHALRNYGYEGYAPSPYVASAATPRGGYSGRGPKGYIRTDDRIKEDVCESLSWNDEVDATEITVRVETGEVTLEGTVETRHMKRLAEDIAEDVTGVQDVHNRLRVSKPMLTELKEKITGESRDEHFANTGTKTTGAGNPAASRNGTP